MYKTVINFDDASFPLQVEDLYNGKVHDGQYDVLVFIGRFAPLHRGHMAVIDVALKKAKKVILLVGSSFRSRTERHPFTFDERKLMIRAAYPAVSSEKLVILPLRDTTYRDSVWGSSVRQAVKNEILETVNSGTGTSFRTNGTNDAKVGLIGCEKDHTSYYLKKFPEWGSVGVKFINPLNATDIRNAYFAGGEFWENVKKSNHLHPNVVEILDDLRGSDGFNYVMKEIEFNRRHAAMWANSPYTPSFNTADSMVVQSGHVLLIRRKSFPGMGLLALPGGYKNPDETLYQTALRELREETKLKVPEKVLRGSMIHNQVFDDPHRSGRGQIVTQAYLFQLEDMEELPKVKGSDDADKAFWMPLDELKEEDFFEDHFHIIQVLKGYLEDKRFA